MNQIEICNNNNNNGGYLYTAYPALALSGLQSIITLVLHVCVHLFNGQATYYTIGAHNHRLVTYTFNYQVEATSRLLITKSHFCWNFIKCLYNKDTYYFDICSNYGYTIPLCIHKWKYKILWSIFYFLLVSYWWGAYIHYLGLLIIFEIGYIYEFILYFITKNRLPMVYTRLPSERKPYLW